LKKLICKYRELIMSFAKLSQIRKRDNMLKITEIDENISNKFWNIFEEPEANEIDVWYKNKILIGGDNGIN